MGSHQNDHRQCAAEPRAARPPTTSSPPDAPAGECAWIRQHHNVLIIGPTGVGKTYLACALAHKACRVGYSALYFRLPRLLQDLALSKGDGRNTGLLKAIARASTCWSSTTGD